jgi:hypothetical protein
VDHTHVHTDGIGTSTIDHFVVSRGLLGMIEDCRPVHRGDNLSRHSLFRLSLRLGEIIQLKTVTPPSPPQMPAWDRATPEELHGYTAALHERLQVVQCPGSLLYC